MSIVSVEDSLQPLKFASLFLSVPSCHYEVVCSVFEKVRPFRSFQETKNQRAA